MSSQKFLGVEIIESERDLCRRSGWKLAVAQTNQALDFSDLAISFVEFGPGHRRGVAAPCCPG